MGDFVVGEFCIERGVMAMTSRNLAKDDQTATCTPEDPASSCIISCQLPSVLDG